MKRFSRAQQPVQTTTPYLATNPQWAGRPVTAAREAATAHTAAVPTTPSTSPGESRSLKSEGREPAATAAATEDEVM